MKRALIMALMLSGAPYVIAASWQSVGKGDKIEVFLDVSSITYVKGSVRKAWTMWDWAEPQDATYAYPKKYSSYKQLDLFNCAERSSATIQILQMEGQHGVGDVVWTHAIQQEKALYKDVVPDILGETVLERVCAQPRGKK
jgi:hypothetical protein